MLVDQLVEAFGAPAAAAAAAAARRRLDEADAAAAQGARCWHRLREAALLVLGNLLTASDGAALDVPAVRAEASAALDAVLARELRPEAIAAAAAAAAAAAEGGDASGGDDAAAGAAALLVGRALWLGARAAPLATAAQKQALLAAAAAAAAAPALPAAAKVGACRALAELAPAVAADTSSGGAAALAAALPGAYAGLVAVLRGATDETAHLALGTLAALVRADTAAGRSGGGGGAAAASNGNGSGCGSGGAVVAARHVMELAGPVLEVWSANVQDPLVAEEGLDVLSALAACPDCLPQLAAHAVPVLARVVASPRGQPPMLVEASLNLLEALVRPSAPAVAEAVARAALAPAAALLAAADDASEACAATNFLTQLVGRAVCLLGARG